VVCTIKALYKCSDLPLPLTIKLMTYKTSVADFCCATFQQQSRPATRPNIAATNCTTSVLTKQQSDFCWTICCKTFSRVQQNSQQESCITKRKSRMTFSYDIILRNSHRRCRFSGDIYMQIYK